MTKDRQLVNELMAAPQRYRKGVSREMFWKVARLTLDGYAAHTIVEKTGVNGGLAQWAVNCRELYTLMIDDEAKLWGVDKWAVITKECVGLNYDTPNRGEL